MASRARFEIVEDDEPPLLDEGSAGGNQVEGVSIMDEMVAIATKAKAAKRQLQEKERNSSSFGAGLKKGFFATAKKKPQRPRSRPERLEAKADSETTKKSSLLLVKKDSDNQSRAQDTDSSSKPFVFPEVQEALQSMNQLNPKDWMDERFFTKLAKRPMLMQALQNPRFSQAMSELQSNPQAAIQKYQHDADVSVMLRDFMEFLGDHFEELGKEQGATQSQPVHSESQPQQQPSPAIVDLDEARRRAISSMDRAPEEEHQVQQIMNNPELLAALSDVKFMEQLRRCHQDPSAFRQLASDAVFAPKLRLLVEAKLVNFT